MLRPDEAHVLRLASTMSCSVAVKPTDADWGPNTVIPPDNKYEPYHRLRLLVASLQTRTSTDCPSSELGSDLVGHGVQFTMTLAV